MRLPEEANTLENRPGISCYCVEIINHFDLVLPRGVMVNNRALYFPPCATIKIHLNHQKSFSDSSPEKAEIKKENRTGILCTFVEP